MKTFAKIFGIIVIGAVSMAILAGCNTLQSIEVSREPTQTVFGQGQNPNWSGLVVMGHFKKDSKEVTNSARVSGYDPGKPGKQTVTVTMEKQSAAFEVTVVPVEKVSISQPPSTTVFMQGDNAVYTGLSALVEFEGGKVSAETVQAGQLKFSGYNKDKAGDQTITVDYYGKKTDFVVRVAALSGIVVVSPPDRIDYFAGEDLELAGLAVKGIWEGVGERPLSITKENLSSFDKNRAAKQDVVITYSGKTTSFSVTFVGMQSIAISQQPAKLEYENGDELDLSGMVVQGTRTGATSIEMVDISRLKVSGYDRFKGGNQTITITLGGKTATFRVTVAPNPFLGVWRGTYVNSFKNMSRPVALSMTEGSWSVTIGEGVDKEGLHYSETKFSGTYVRDANNGKTAKLTLKEGDRMFAPDTAEILSTGEVRLTSKDPYNPTEVFSREGLTLTR